MLMTSVSVGIKFKERLRNEGYTEEKSNEIIRTYMEAVGEVSHDLSEMEKRKEQVGSHECE